MIDGRRVVAVVDRGGWSEGSRSLEQDERQRILQVVEVDV